MATVKRLLNLDYITTGGAQFVNDLRTLAAAQHTDLDNLLVPAAIVITDLLNSFGLPDETIDQVMGDTYAG